jgi:hypothetical protein
MLIRFNLSIVADILLGDNPPGRYLSQPKGADHGSFGVKFKNRDEYVTEKQPDGQDDYTFFSCLMYWLRSTTYLLRI